MLSLLGDRIEKGRIRRHAAEGHPFWDRVARAVMRRPVVWLVAGVSVMLVLAVPALGLQTGFSGIDALPPRHRVEQVFTILTTQFGVRSTAPIEVVVDGNVAVRDGEGRDRRTSDPPDRRGSRLGPSSVRVEGRDEPGGRLGVAYAGNPNAPESLRAVERIRDEYVPEAFAERSSRRARRW